MQVGDLCTRTSACQEDGPIGPEVRSDGNDVEAFTAGDDRVALPDDLPGANDVVRAVFTTYEAAGALEFLLGQKVIYLLPWAARRGGVAAYEQHLNTFRARPVELTADEVESLLKNHRPREVSLANTPAWLLDDRGVDDVHVSWHARVRWGERVNPSPDPGPAIRDAFEDAVSVGVAGDGVHGRYHGLKDLLFVYVYDRSTPVVTTVYHPDDVQDLGVDHLVECPQCDELYDPGNQQMCTCCAGPICPWCGETVA